MLLTLFLLMAARFWETKPSTDWTLQELDTFVSDSPWAQTIRTSGTAPPAILYLATAAPMRIAEVEVRRRYVRAGGPVDNMHEDYELLLRENEGQIIAVAVKLQQSEFPDDAAEIKKMEDQCQLKVGRRKFKLSGHFAPSRTDPYLRLIFPREVSPNDKSLDIQVYVPGLSSPYREARFPLKDLIYKGKLEF